MKNQTLAQIWFEQIGDDGTKPLKRPKDPTVDREFRELIEYANNHGDVIINDGAGYYRPKRGDGFDEHCYNIYKAKELAKAKKIIKKIERMDAAFYGGGNE